MNNKSTNIIDFLITEKDSKIKSLQTQRDLIKKVDPNNAVFKVNIWCEDLKYLEKKYSGSIADAVKTAEAEFLQLNNIDKISVMSSGTFDVYLCVGKDEYHLKKELWEDYRL